MGIAYGAVLQFTTPTPPTVTTTAVSSLTNTSAYLNGTGNPDGSATTGYFRYSLTNPGTCDDVFGSRAPAAGGTALGSGNSAVGFSQQITGLSAGTTYYYCAIAQSFEGTAFGAILSFTTPTVPTATTLAATLVTSSSATLNGSANPDGNAASGYFRYATSNPGVCSDAFGTRAPPSSLNDSALGGGATDVAFSRAIAGLTPGTTYYYCAIVYNSYGFTYGSILSFTTQATLPTVTTNAATLITTTTATLNATANPNGAATTGWFRYATASPGSCNDSFGTRTPAAGGSALGAGVSNVNYSQGIVGLTPGTTYYFCAIVQNSVGTTFGLVLSFATTAPPTVNTLAATPVTATTATLNGTVNPNGFTTTGWFRYSTTNPGACDQVFGTATDHQNLGAGSSAVALAQPLASLSPATTYYFCAIAQSAIGTTLGAVLSFTTPAAPPSVTTVAASSILDTSATLNATVNPNGGDSTGWFRYATTNPGTCSDAFGTRLPAAGGTALGSGNTAVPMSLSATAARGRDDVLLLRARLERRRHLRGHGALVHHGRRADGDDHGGECDHEHGRHAQRLGEPERVGGHRVVPLRHDQPWLVQRRLRDARAGGRRHGARLGLQLGRVLAGDLGPHARDHVLLLRHRAERGGHVLRRRPLVQHGVDADGDDHGGERDHEHGRHAQRLGEPEPAHVHRVVPLQHHQPRELQRRLRDARSGGRRHGARRGIERGAVPAGHRGPRGVDDVLLLRDRLERGGHRLRSGDVVHDVGPAAGDDLGCDRDDQHGRHAQRLGEPEPARRRPGGSATAPPTRVAATTSSGRARRRPAAPRSAPGRAPCPTRRPSRASRPGTTYYFCAIARTRRARPSGRCCRSRRWRRRR